MKAYTASLFPLSLLLSSLVSALTLDCSNIRIGNVKYDLSKLRGPHSVSVIDKNQPPAVHNTTWTLDICDPLKLVDGVEKADQCPQNTWVCGIDRSYNPVDDPDKKHWLVTKVLPVAGSFHVSDGKGLDPKPTRQVAQDNKAEGLELQLHGGTYNKRDQKAVIQFTCDQDRDGNEVSMSGLSILGRRDDDNDDNKEDDKNSLTYISYGPDDAKGDIDVLRLKWKTKYVCDSQLENEGESKGSWGFFTWLILLLFLGISAYLIFGSWLNYNRYGARGWDLLPHGDTIRDIPYLFKDWSRKVVDTVSGSGSRGGYSAV